MALEHLFAVHGHFYQPPRGNPLLGDDLREPGASPYRNWNERITAESYRPHAEIGNFELISFNIGETLASWMARHAADVHGRIVAADNRRYTRIGAGNAIAQPMHHTILPLDRRPDKETQVRWGLAAFRKRFGRTSRGMWLPEMAVDMETLEVLVENGVQWTILSESQIIDKPRGGGPFWVELSDRGRIMVFVRDEHLSNDIAFNLGHFGGAHKWAREVLAKRRRRAGLLTLIATDGETFGHHWRGEEVFLHWLLTMEAENAGFRVVTLGELAAECRPRYSIRIREDSAWSSGFGLGRWLTGSPDTQGDSYWKGALHRAMDSLRIQLDLLYRSELRRIDPSIDPNRLRESYIRVLLGELPREALLMREEVDASPEDQLRLLRLIESQYHRQQMYASCAYFFADLDDLSTRYGIANAAYAARLSAQATGEDLLPDFRRDLRLARGVNRAGQFYTGADILDDLLREFETTSVHQQ